MQLSTIGFPIAVCRYVEMYEWRGWGTGDNLQEYVAVERYKPVIVSVS